MKNLKINITYSFHEGSWGGGNQFLKALRKILIKKGYYENNPNKADCILFNSHHNIEKVLQLKLDNQNKIFVHRIDGPLYLIRNNELNIDNKIYKLNNLIADGTILQSKWSQRKNHSVGLKRNIFETVIMNASDRATFFPKKNTPPKVRENNKWKLVAVSWSKNFNKGFDLYHYLDENLDFNKYSMIFVGNSPISFKNIKYIKPVESYELANLLRESDIYINGSKNDPCSNSLIEALTCGLPAVALNDGGHPEILKKGGEVFNTFEECLIKIQLVKDNYEKYRNNISIPSIEEIFELYINFIKEIYKHYLSKNYRIKKLGIFSYYKILLMNNLLQISNLKKLIINELSRIRNSLIKRFSS